VRDSDPDLVSTSEFATEAAALVKRVRDTGQAIMVTDEGRPAAVLVTAEEFAAYREHRHFVGAVNEGLADVEAGRVLTTDALKASLEAEFGSIAWR
jgi:prevent-host-death family protein